MESLETLNHYRIVHNDIKPQNYLVKFLNGPNDLTQIDIVLTDFGLVGQTKGGTPIFASPECFDVKTAASDIFSLGRLFLFMLLKKESFLKILFVPITSSTDSAYLNSAILTQNNLLGLIHQMLSINASTRIGLSDVRSELNRLRINSQIRLNTLEINQIEIISTMNMSPVMESYIQDLDHIS